MTDTVSFYRHYKNKDYKLLGSARHSETLEELALYEARYPNERGQVWVRPKEMFHEKVKIDGQDRPRFAKVQISFVERREIDEPMIDSIVELLDRVFDSYSRQEFKKKMANREGILLVVASEGERFVGFKVGYQWDGESFYSALGAVHPEYQGFGIGGALIAFQHKKCREYGHSKIRTKTKNKWKSMLMLNIRGGFDIVGTETRENGEVKILMEKELPS